MGGVMFLLFRSPPCPVCGQRVSAVEVLYLLFAGRPTGHDLYRMKQCGHEFERRDQPGWVDGYQRAYRRSEYVIVPAVVLLLVALMLGLTLAIVAALGGR